MFARLSLSHCISTALLQLSQLPAFLESASLFPTIICFSLCFIFCYSVVGLPSGCLGPDWFTHHASCRIIPSDQLGSLPFNRGVVFFRASSSGHSPSMGCGLYVLGIFKYRLHLAHRVSLVSECISGSVRGAHDRLAVPIYGVYRTA